MRLHHKRIIPLFILLCSTANIELSAAPFSEAKLIFSNVTIAIELAATPEERKIGLMGRSHLPSGHGMLFTYPEPHHVSFWMKNTPLSLDILYFNEHAELIQYFDNATPCRASPCKRYPSNRPVLYVLELGAGERQKLGIKRHDKFTIEKLKF